MAPVTSLRALAPVVLAAADMDCGTGVSLCGVLVLESGYGPDHYEHSSPVVHGLWPQTSPYGNSECIAPQDSSDLTKILECYDDLSFQQHEWGKHGVCAGVVDAADFFGQICNLASAPLKVMAGVKAQGGSLSAMETAVTNAGYPVYQVDSGDSQIYLSACAGPDGKWKIGAVDDFPTLCPGGDGPAPSPPPSGQTCISGQHGPRCSADGDCAGASNCVRCAHSGYCTDVPLSGSEVV